MDILTALPPELSMKVLKHLTPIETIKLRVVSKSYNDLLTSEEICSLLSRRFIAPEDNSTKVLPSWRLHYENHLSRRLSFASGEPWLVESLGPADGAVNISFCPETRCLALTIGDSVSVQDVNSYPVKCVLPPTHAPDRSWIADAVLLPSFVVLASPMGHGYAWNLGTHKEHQFELPESRVTGMSGSRNLVAISLEGWVIVHDVQAQETSRFKDTRSDIRVWGREEIMVDFSRGCMVTSPEKKVVWMICQTSASGHYLLVIDSLHLETGEFVQRDICEFPNLHSTPSYSRNGLWIFPEQAAYGYPQKRNNTGETAKRAIFDQATGRLTLEYIPVTSPHRLWMLNQQPGGKVARAQPLDLYTPERPLEVVWFCDKFALFRTESEVCVARFAGIHDNYEYDIPVRFVLARLTVP